jgi:Skp family chaperone for outer membrane proteins
VALREELDTIKGRYEDKIQGMERAARDEIKQLQETAAALREKLETENGE